MLVEREADIKGNSNTKGENKSDEKHAGDNDGKGSVRSDNVTVSRGASASTVTN